MIWYSVSHQVLKRESINKLSALKIPSTMSTRKNSYVTGINYNDTKTLLKSNQQNQKEEGKGGVVALPKTANSR